jgi:hypothetical protein
VPHPHRTLRGFWALPAFFATWANLHGAWVVGAGVLIVWSAATVVWEPRTLRRSEVLAILASAPTPATPHGTALWRFVNRRTRLARGHRMVSDLTASPLLWIEWLVGVALIGVCLRHREVVSQPAIAVACALAVGASGSRKNPASSLVTNIVIVGPALAVWAPLPARDRNPAAGETSPLVTLLAAVVCWPCVLYAMPHGR